jgi:hypothetical protein
VSAAGDRISSGTDQAQVLLLAHQWLEQHRGNGVSVTLLRDNTPIDVLAALPGFILVSFVTGTDDHPADQSTTLEGAKSMADDWSSSHASAAIKVINPSTGEVLYDLPGNVVPATP